MKSYIWEIMADYQCPCPDCQIWWADNYMPLLMADFTPFTPEEVRRRTIAFRKANPL